jgi:hypothetical protein
VQGTARQDESSGQQDHGTSERYRGLEALTVFP